jgi:hypothetical protein
MKGLSIDEEAYAMLYTRCTLRFPNTLQFLPKPLFTQSRSASAPSASFSVQAPPPLPLPAPQPWPIAATPSSTPQFASDPSSFFRSRARPDGCAFCVQPGHRVRECPSAREYVRAGRVLRPVFILVSRAHLYLYSASMCTTGPPRTGLPSLFGLSRYLDT